MKLEPQRTARYYYLRFVRLKGDPGVLARGVAIGLFIGITPTIPLHTILILLLAFVTRSSKVAGLLTSLAISNPLTIPPTYYLCWRVGAWVTRTDISWLRIKEVLEQVLSDAAFMERMAALAHLGREAMVTLMLGGFLLALPAAMAGYVVAFRFFATVRRKRQERQGLR